ncbi:MAG: Unknown protein, partial [uncultured Thiotrichaceae bacterium]
KPNLYFFRDSQGREIDILHKSGRDLLGIEIKSSSTWNASFKKALQHFSKNHHTLIKSYIAYSGENKAFSDHIEALNFRDISRIFN